MSIPKDGVVAFSITQGMPLTGIYDYKPNPNGPVITPRNGFFEVSRTPKSESNQWTMFSIKVPKPVANGCIFQFNVSYSGIKVFRSDTPLEWPSSSLEILEASYRGQVKLGQRHYLALRRQ
jgi:hypothetical protein